MGKTYDDSPFFMDGYYGSKGSSKGHSFKSCYETHPALVLGDFKVYGGNCSKPIIKDADIYIALQAGGYSGLGTQPWHEGKQVLELPFFITDMQAPKDPAEFKRMIDWVCNQLREGKKVHVGCIGGHGRTGTVLAALTKVMLGEEDAITYVREHYCPKAVETSSQIAFLHKHFGIKEVKGTKTTASPVAYPTSTSTQKGSRDKDWWGKANPLAIKGVAFSGSKRTIDPVPSARCVWGTSS